MSKTTLADVTCSAQRRESSLLTPLASPLMRSSFSNLLDVQFEHEEFSEENDELSEYSRTVAFRLVDQDDQGCDPSAHPPAATVTHGYSVPQLKQTTANGSGDVSQSLDEVESEESPEIGHRISFASLVSDSLMFASDYHTVY
eukprot:ANDGO_03684.mRNA.1 hypothetical protein